MLVVTRPQTILSILLLTFCALLSASAAEKPWVEVHSPHFRVLSDGSERDARRVAREFEQMRAVLSGQFLNLRLESGAPLLVLAPRDEESMKALAPLMWKRKGAKPAGFFQHGWEKQYAVVQLDQDTPGAYQVVYHEYTHSLLHLNFRWLPIWLDEGLAEFYGNTRFEKDRIYVGAPTVRFSVLRNGSLFPLDKLLLANGSSPYYHDEDKVQMFYAESWALVHYLTFGPGMEHGVRMNQFYHLLQQGMDQKKAFEQVFGDTKELQNNLDQYVHKFAMQAYVIANPPQIDSDRFATRNLTVAESETELGAYHLWSHDLAHARPLLEAALTADPKLGVAHENIGFLDFADGKDADAVREFTEAYALDNNLYLSLFYKTMLSPMVQSSTPGDTAGFEDALSKTLSLNSNFAPAYIQLACLYAGQGKLSNALGLVRRAEELEPSRAGYYLLDGQIQLRLGQSAQAAAIAKYVADRWFGPDHNEAVDLWNDVPVADRPAGEELKAVTPPGTQVSVGHLLSTNCSEKDHSLEVVLDHDGQALKFHSTASFIAGFSDTVWFGADHFQLCRHLEGMRAILYFKPSSNSAYAGDIAELELRESLPPPQAPATSNQSDPPKAKP
jgi:Tfp pilus assembly protein PilF